MIKLATTVDCPPLDVRLSLHDRILVLGSCFADSMGRRMADAGFDVLVNPFGTLYNPCSIAAALERLESGLPFTQDDCVPMGAGAGKICSFSHHTSFARPTAEEFLKVANDSLSRAAAFWKTCTKVVVTFGTAYVWRRDGVPVSNCLKRPGTEFTHERLSVGDIVDCVERIERVCGGRGIVFTVSPIRHMGQGAHLNTLSKSSLLLALEGRCYFPAYEILLDELRDYRFFAQDLVHPSPLAEAVIWERLLDAAVPAGERPLIEAAEKAARAARHVCKTSD